MNWFKRVEREAPQLPAWLRPADLQVDIDELNKALDQPMAVSESETAVAREVRGWRHVFHHGAARD